MSWGFGREMGGDAPVGEIVLEWAREKVKILNMEIYEKNLFER